MAGGFNVLPRHSPVTARDLVTPAQGMLDAA